VTPRFLRTVIMATLPVALVGAGFAVGAGTELGGDPVVPVTVALSTMERLGDQPALRAVAAVPGQALVARRTTNRRHTVSRTAPARQPGAVRPPTAAMPGAAAVPPGDPTLESQVVTLVNRARLAKGCRALRVDARLVTAARLHSADMATYHYFSHTGRNGSTYASRVRATGYPSPLGENIAWGYRSAVEVMNAWMNSAGHRANILNCASKATGVGYDPRKNMWTQMFGFQ
jgi:uncharacterized protein YkwD